MGSPSENKELVSGFLDAFAAGDVAAAGACFEEDRYSHAYEADLAGYLGQADRGVRGQRLVRRRRRTNRTIADEDRVAHHASFTGTHTGTFLGLPPTGRRLTLALLDIWRVDNDKIVEHWGGFQITDGLMAQLRT